MSCKNMSPTLHTLWTENFRKHCSEWPHYLIIATTMAVTVSLKNDAYLIKNVVWLGSSNRFYLKGLSYDCIIFVIWQLTEFNILNQLQTWRLGAHSNPFLKMYQSLKFWLSQEIDLKYSSSRDGGPWLIYKDQSRQEQWVQISTESGISHEADMTIYWYLNHL